jgi:hypothetical protein
VLVARLVVVSAAPLSCCAEQGLFFYAPLGSRALEEQRKVRTFKATTRSPMIVVMFEEEAGSVSQKCLLMVLCDV